MPETIGQRLKQAREEHQLTLEKAFESTRIRLHYLQALESDDYSSIPSAAQARGFLRTYAEFLGLDLSEALAEVQRSRPQPAEEVSGPLPKVDLVPNVLTVSQASAEEEPEPSKAETPGPLDQFRASLTGRFRKKAASAGTEAVSPEPVQAEQTQAEAPSVEIAPAQTVSEEPVPVKPRRRAKKIETTDEVAQPTESVEEQKLSKPRRKKKEAVIEAPVVESVVEAAQAEAGAAAVGSEQVEVPNEAQDAAPSLWSRVKSMFRLRFNPPASSEAVEVAAGPLPGPDPASAVEVPAETPEEIFAEIGASLRKRREMLSLTIDEVERHIKVRAAFVTALEDGAFDRLPSAVQTRGMLANYTAFLDLDTEAVLLRFADAIQAGHRMRYPEKPAGNKSPMRISPTLPPLRSFIAGDLVFGITIAVLLIGMAIWGVNRVFSAQEVERAALPTAPSISDVLATSQQPTLEQQVTLIPAADTPISQEGVLTPSATLEDSAFDANITVQVNLVVVDRTFLRVVVDGEEALNGRVLPGATYTYNASDHVEVLTGNAAALRVTYNGRELGLMGNFGEVADRIYTAGGVVTPTPVAPPTATPSQTPTPADTPTPTPRPSSTPGG